MMALAGENERQWILLGRQVTNAIKRFWSDYRSLVLLYSSWACPLAKAWLVGLLQHLLLWIVWNQKRATPIHSLTKISVSEDVSMSYLQLKQQGKACDLDQNSTVSDKLLNFYQIVEKLCINLLIWPLYGLQNSAFPQIDLDLISFSKKKSKWISKIGINNLGIDLDHWLWPCIFLLWSTSMAVILIFDLEQILMIWNSSDAKLLPCG